MGGSHLWRAGYSPVHWIHKKKGPMKKSRHVEVQETIHHSNLFGNDGRCRWWGIYNQHITVTWGTPQYIKPWFHHRWRWGELVTAPFIATPRSSWALNSATRSCAELGVGSCWVVSSSSWNLKCSSSHAGAHIRGLQKWKKPRIIQSSWMNISILKPMVTSGSITFKKKPPSSSCDIGGAPRPEEAPSEWERKTVNRKSSSKGSKRTKLSTAHPLRHGFGFKP
jgi:hypothetical protein